MDISKIDEMSKTEVVTELYRRKISFHSKDSHAKCRAILRGYIQKEFNERGCYGHS